MQPKKKMKVNNLKRIVILFALIFVLSCEDLFTRFKYETYECGKNPVKLKKIFIKNYNIGDLVDVEFKDDAFKMEITENSGQFMILKRIDPKIEIDIDKKSSLIKINFKNHISNFTCSNYVFKMWLIKNIS